MPGGRTPAVKHRSETTTQPHTPAKIDLRSIAGLTGTLSLGLILIANSPAHAQTSREDVERQLIQRKDELSKTKDRATKLTSGVSQLEREREEINARLLKTAALIQQSEERMTSIEVRISELQEQERLVRGSLNERHGEIAQLLGALQRMGRNPPPVMVTRRKDALEMVRSAMLLAAAFPGLRKQAFALSKRLNNLVRVMTNIRKEGDKLRSETKRLNDARTKLVAVMKIKKQTLAQQQTELATVRKAAAEIRRNLTDLNELITALDKTVKDNTGLGRYDAELRARQNNNGQATSKFAAPSDTTTTATAKNSDNAENQKVAVFVPPKRDQIIEIAPPDGGFESASPARIKPAVPFRKTRGRLPLPARGRRIISFGEKTQHGSRSKGMVLETRFSAQITSPSDGWVVYAGKFRSYGKLLIINAGDGYHILLAGLSNIDVEQGQFVLAAEPVGTMNAAPEGRRQAKKKNAPVLYIEFRKNGRPINPDPWWVASRQKAT